MNWEKVGKFLTAFIASVAGIAAIYQTFSYQQANLEAYLTYDYQTYPQQFTNRIKSIKEKSNYLYLYENIEQIAEDKLSHSQLNKITSFTQKLYKDFFSNPFGNGLNEYGVRLFIYLENDGDKTAKDIYIKLPARGLVLVRDDAKNYKIIEHKTSNITIPSIVQNGDSMIWVYFNGNYNDIKESTINIGHSEGSANINIYKSYTGLNSIVAQYSAEIFALIIILIGTVIVLLCIQYLPTPESSSNS